MIGKMIHVPITSSLVNLQGEFLLLHSLSNLLEIHFGLYSFVLTTV